MKIYLLLIVCLCFGCNTAVKLTPKKASVVKSVLAKQHPVTAVFIEGDEIKHEPAPSTNLITSFTRFASLCPYCGQASVSRSCTVTSATASTNGTFQEWSIYYLCPACHMSFTDSRSQTLPPVQSVMLPIVE